MKNLWKITWHWTCGDFLLLLLLLLLLFCFFDRKQHLMLFQNENAFFKFFCVCCGWGLIFTSNASTRIQCFHWPNITRCGKYPSACVMPERYFVFNANASTSAVTRKRKISILMLLLMPSSRLFSRWNKNYCVYVCARVASEPYLNSITVLLLEIGRFAPGPFAPGPSAPSCIISWMKTPQQFR